MTKLPRIKEGELERYFDELDALRPKDTGGLTDEQYEYIKYARENEKPVLWSRIVQWWVEKGWGSMNISTLKTRYTARKIHEACND